MMHPDKDPHYPYNGPRWPGVILDSFDGQNIPTALFQPAAASATVIVLPDDLDLGGVNDTIYEGPDFGVVVKDLLILFLHSLL
jgi:hypothetical protein